MTWAVIDIKNVQNIDTNLIIRYSELMDKVLVESNESTLPYEIEGPFDENEKEFLLTTYEWLTII